MENSFLRDKRLWVVIVVIALLALYFFINKGASSISPVSADGAITWQMPMQNGINEQTTTQARDELITMLNTEEDTQTKYEIAIGIAGIYRTLGDGENALVYLNKAVDTDPERALAYMNAGYLFSQLFATTSARTYFELGVSKEPQYEQNHLLYISFLQTSGASNEDIEKAFTEGLTRTGRHDNLLKEYAGWLSRTEKIPEAITIWEEVLARNPPNKSAIEYEIQKLKNKNAQ
jgi:tetratricopeptide (TPR) repeat protein